MFTPSSENIASTMPFSPTCTSLTIKSPSFGAGKTPAAHSAYESQAVVEVFTSAAPADIAHELT